jgi:hypothetical protein
MILLAHLGMLIHFWRSSRWLLISNIWMLSWPIVNLEDDVGYCNIVLIKWNALLEWRSPVYLDSKILVEWSWIRLREGWLMK